MGAEMAFQCLVRLAVDEADDTAFGHRPANLSCRRHRELRFGRGRRHSGRAECQADEGSMDACDETGQFFHRKGVVRDVGCHNRNREWDEVSTRVLAALKHFVAFNRHDNRLKRKTRRYPNRMSVRISANDRSAAFRTRRLARRRPRGAEVHPLCCRASFFPTMGRLPQIHGAAVAAAGCSSGTQRASAATEGLGPVSKDRPTAGRRVL